MTSKQTPISVAIVDPDVGYRRGLQVVLQRDPAVQVLLAVDRLAEVKDFHEPIDVALVAERVVLTEAKPDQLSCRIICMPKVKRRTVTPCELPYGDEIVARSVPLAQLLIAVHRLARNG